MWKPTGQENLWIQGGNFHQDRHYSLYLALQLKARLAGINTPVYPTPVTHHPEGGRPPLLFITYVTIKSKIVCDMHEYTRISNFGYSSSRG
eukprot:Pgem_evm1s2129